MSLDIGVRLQRITVMSMAVLSCLGIVASCAPPINLREAINETAEDINELYYRESGCPKFGLLLSEVTVVFQVSEKKGAGGGLTVGPNPEVSVGSKFSTTASRSNTITLKFENFLPRLMDSSPQANNIAKGSVLGSLIFDPALSSANQAKPSGTDLSLQKDQQLLKERILRVLSYDLTMGNTELDQKAVQGKFKEECLKAYSDPSRPVPRIKKTRTHP